MPVSIKLRLFTSVLSTSVDLFICLLLSSYNLNTFNPNNILLQFSEFSLYTGTLDLIFLAGIRFCLWVLHSYIVWNDQLSLLNNPNVGHARSIVFLLLYCYTIVKLLLFAENELQDHSLTTPQILYLIWNPLATLLLHVAIWTLPSSNTLIDYYRLDEEDDEDNVLEEDIAPRKKIPEVIMRFSVYIKREWKLHVQAAIALNLCAAAKVFTPYYVGNVITVVVATKSYEVLHQALLIVVAVYLFGTLTGCVRWATFEYVQFKIENALRFDLYSALLNSEIAFYDAHKTGALVSRLSADVECLSATLPDNLNVFLRNSLMLIGSLFFMLYLSWRLTLVSFIVLPFLWIVLNIVGVMWERSYEKSQKLRAKCNDVAQEVISSMRTIRSFAGEESEMHRYYQTLSSTYKIDVYRGFITMGYCIAEETIPAINLILVMWYGGHLVLTGRMQPELLVSFMLYHMQMITNIQEISYVMTGLMQSVGASRTIFQYMDRQPAIVNRGTHQPSKIEGKIEFRNVRFSYPTRKDNEVLKGISFIIQPGETVALVGHSGSGKSSCIQLLEHFYEANSGQVLIDGVPLEEYEHHYIHRKIALVGQEPVLFGRAIADNIKYGVDDKTETDVVKAAELANAHNFIMDQPQKYETSAGEKGSQLSGGQKQRIAIARALVRDPSILLLDEATSALDTQSEFLVQDAIYKNMKGRTVLLIAHRLSTVEKADRIIVMDKGVIAEMGTHQELIQQQGLYAALVNRQMIGREYSTAELLVPERRPWSVPIPIKSRRDPRICRSF